MSEPKAEASAPSTLRDLRSKDEAQAHEWALLCKAGTRLCALPLTQVRETMRPLPIVPLAGAPAFVRGLSQIRGASMPVVDLAELLGEAQGPFGRFVTIVVGARYVALAASSVVGVRAIDATRLERLPLLLSEAAPAVAAIGRLDAELLLVLSAMHFLPEDAPEGADTPS